MTGYGRAFNADFRVEVRSTNHKTLDIQLNIPAYLYPYEERIRKQIRERFQRGRIEVRVSGRDADYKRPRINKALAREYYRELLSLKDELSIPGDIEIRLLSSIPGIFVIEEAIGDIKSFDKVLVIAFDDLERSRIREGRGLASDIKKRLALLKRSLAGIERRQKIFKDSTMEGMRKRIRELLDGMPINESRLIQEIAIMIERSDITEEIVRIKSHLKSMQGLIASDEAIGKKMDFFAQELHREINTIGSKAPDVTISNYVVEMKHEVEKIREQVQNLQ